MSLPRSAGIKASVIVINNHSLGQMMSQTRPSPRSHLLSGLGVSAFSRDHYGWLRPKIFQGILCSLGSSPIDCKPRPPSPTPQLSKLCCPLHPSGQDTRHHAMVGPAGIGVRTRSALPFGSHSPERGWTSGGSSRRPPFRHQWPVFRLVEPEHTSVWSLTKNEAVLDNILNSRLTTTTYKTLSQKFQKN